MSSRRSKVRSIVLFPRTPFDTRANRYFLEKGAHHAGAVFLTLMAVIILWLCYTSLVGARTAGFFQGCLAMIFGWFAGIWYSGAGEGGKIERSIKMRHMQHLTLAESESYRGFRVMPWRFAR